LSPSFSPQPAKTDKAKLASVTFVWEGLNENHTQAAFALLLSKYSGERSFPLAVWDSQNNCLIAVPVEITSDTLLADICSHSESEPIESSPTVLVFDSALPPQLTDYEVAVCLPPASLPDSEGTISYRSDLFSSQTVTAWSKHLRKILSYPATTPIGEVQLLETEEQEKALNFAGNPEPTLYPPQNSPLFTFPILFEKQCALTPNNRALWCQGQEWTYQELNSFANRVANRLHKKEAVDVGDRIGVCLERNPEFLGVLLGIMKAGAAYVPLEPDLPEERRQFIAQDAKVKTTIDQDWLDALAQSNAAEESPEPILTSQDAAYLIYTSGSTGEPKGVEVQHHALCDFSLVMRESYHLGEEHTWLAITTIAFDACIMELFPLLLAGGTVALAPPTNATHLWATPTSLRILISSGWQGSPDLTIFTGGEAVDRDIAELTLPLCKTLINGYGPTETTVFATNHIITSGTGPVPLGRPMEHMTMYLLDDDGHLLPPLARGHFWIGGQGVSLGYLNRAELTNERFIKDPFSPNKDARMYQSGDLGYHDPAGTLYYLGRSDHQVKLRGYRIELGEIEATLLEHPAVEDTVVLVREDRPGEQRLVAYLIAPTNPTAEDLQEHLAEKLPEYMVPAWFVPLDSFPVTTGRKIDRRALPAPPEPEAPQVEPGSNNTGNELASAIAALWARILGRPSISIDDHVFRLGANSLNATRFQILLAEELDRHLPVAQIFQHPTPTALANHFQGKKQQRKATTNEHSNGPIAIIGMACRFPGAPDLDSYWDLIKSGTESIQTFSHKELIESGISPAEVQHPNYVARGTILDKALDFEPSFFGVSRQDASVLSPQFRLFMKTTWEALENAGYPEEPADASIGVFAGAGDPAHLSPTRDQPEPERLKILVGNSADFLATRTSFSLGLTGPAVAVQAACSTSLVAIAEACHALRAGRCSMALAGGASFSWPHAQGYLAGEGLMFSPTGTCRPFDHRADGTIFSQGAGVVLLKPLQQAQDDGDLIHAVIRGIATNNDGDRKASYAAPSIEGQAEVIRQALDDAALSAREVGYVEAHGTGTKIGDPIEVAALTSAYREDTPDNSYCGLGSVKGNIGHTDAASGVAGLIKAALSLRHRTLPASLHFEKANPEITFEQTPFQVHRKCQEWKTEDSTKTRIAAVNSLGMGGTNAHAILEESPLPDPAQAAPAHPWHFLPLSARSAEALEGTVNRLRATALSDQAATAYTLTYKRRAFEHRAFTIALPDKALPEFEFHQADSEKREPVFLFTGQGSQYARMGQSLLHDEPVFRKAIEDCERHLPNGLSWLYPTDQQKEVDINQTSLTQPALFSVMWAQAQLWLSWGIQPVAMAGHSIGEYVAATMAGVFTLEDALKIVTKRSQLMQSAPTGTMLAVFTEQERIEKVLQAFPQLDLAAVNAPDLSVIAGDDATIKAAETSLEAEGLRCRRVRTSHAFHSRAMEGILAEFQDYLSTFTLEPPRIPYPSNVTGDWITAEEATSPTYYTQQLRGTVRFSDNVRTLTQGSTPRLLLEMGPGATLSSLAARQLGNSLHQTLQTFADRKEADATAFARQALGRAWVKGLSLPHPVHVPRPLSLPPTLFSEETFEKPAPPQENAGEPAPLFHLPTWKQEPLCLPSPPSSEQPWLIFSRSLAQRSLDLRGLRELTKNAIFVSAGKDYRRINSRSYCIRSNEPNDYLALLETVFSEHGAPAGILHTWSLDQNPSLSSALSGASNHSPTDFESFRQSLATSASSLTWLAKALARQPLRVPLPLTILTSGILHEKNSPANAALPAIASVIQKEIPAVMTKVLEVGIKRPADFLSLVQTPEHYPHLGYRDNSWWSRTYSPANLPVESETLSFEKDETIVITGGLGGLALATCLGLAQHSPGIRFILLARNPAPQSDYQKETLAQIEALGCPVSLLQMDLLQEKSIAEAASEIKKLPSSHKLAGLIHTAAVLEDGAIANKDPESFWRVFTTKVFGARLLNDRLAEKELTPRFEVFFSSVASDLGLFGQVDYSAANAYLDGFVADRRRQGIQSHAINWPAFHSVGMAARTASKTNTVSANFDLSLTDELANNALAPEEAPQAILAILRAKTHPRVAISRLSFRDKQEAAIADGRTTRLTQNDGSKDILLDSPPEERMLEIWRTHLGLPDLQEDDDYFEAGGDSLAAVALTAAIERAFDCPVPISHLMGSPTSAGLCSRLGFGQDSSPTQESELPPFLHLLHPGKSDHPPLVLIHGASGGILFLKPFASQLDTGHPIYAFEAPMLHDLEATAPNSMEDLASHYISVLKEHLPERFLLGGYSLGGIVAYEMAQQLHKEGRPPLRLLLFDTPNPSVPVTYHSPLQRLSIFWKCQEDADLPQKLGRLLHRMTTGAGTRIVREFEKRASASSQASTNEHWRHVQCLEQHSPLEDAYQPQHYPGELTVLVTDFVHDKFTYAENLGWDNMVKDLRVSPITGPHLDIFNPPHLDVLLAATRQAIRIEESEE